MAGLIELLQGMLTGNAGGRQAPALPQQNTPVQSLPGNAGLIDMIHGADRQPLQGGSIQPMRTQQTQPQPMQGNPAPQPQPMPQQAAPRSGGGMGDFLSALGPAIAMLDPRNQQLGMGLMAARQDQQERRTVKERQNVTFDWLKKRGMSDEAANVLIANPDGLKSYIAEAFKGNDPQWDMGEMFDPATGKRVKIYYDKRNPSRYNVLGGVESDTLSPEAEAQKARIAQAGATNVNVNPGEKAWDQESAKLFAKRYDDISSGAMNAQQMMGMYDLAEQALNSGVRTGFGAEAELNLRQLGSAMGLDTDPEKMAGGELIRSIQNRMALLMRSPDGGMGMPGALSDRDIKFLKDSQIGIDRTPEGNKRMLQAYRAMEGRKIDIARLADQYVEENGRLDSGFNQAIRKWAAANPLFSDEVFRGAGTTTGRTRARNPKTGEILEWNGTQWGPAQ